MINFTLISRIFSLWANFFKKRPMEYFKTHSIILWEGSPKRFDHWFEWPFCFRIQTLKTDRVEIKILNQKTLQCNFSKMSYPKKEILVNRQRDESAQRSKSNIINGTFDNLNISRTSLNNSIIRNLLEILMLNDIF
jgi:hypothetical protein